MKQRSEQRSEVHDEFDFQGDKLLSYQDDVSV